jgi:RNA polymerase sigma factor (sigma-70 family)
MEATHTTAAVQRYLDELRVHPEGAGAPQVVRELLGRSAMRLHLLCSSMIRRSYPRLARPPLNLRSEEMLGAVVERLMKAMREARPANVREFFGLANQHMRWELNDLARRLDEHTPPVAIEADRVADRTASELRLSASARRILAALDSLGDDEREVFGLVRIQGLSHSEASEVLGVATKTIQRRLNRCRVQLASLLKDLDPQGGSPGGDGAEAREPSRS